MMTVSKAEPGKIGMAVGGSGSQEAGGAAGGGPYREVHLEERGRKIRSCHVWQPSPAFLLILFILILMSFFPALVDQNLRDLFIPAFAWTVIAVLSGTIYTLASIGPGLRAIYEKGIIVRLPQAGKIFVCYENVTSIYLRKRDGIPWWYFRSYRWWNLRSNQRNPALFAGAIIAQMVLSQRVPCLRFQRKGIPLEVIVERMEWAHEVASRAGLEWDERDQSAARSLTSSAKAERPAHPSSGNVGGA